MEKSGEERKQYYLNVLAQGSGRVLSVAAVMGAYVLGARCLPVETFGKYAYILTFVGILGAVADFGMTPTLSRDIAQVGGRAPVYWGNYLTLRLGVNAVVIVLGILAALFLRPELFPYLAAGSLCLPFINSRFFEPIYQTYRRPFYSLYSSGFYAFLYLLLTILGVSSFNSLGAIYGAYLFSNLAYSALAFYLSYRLIRPIFRMERDVLKSILTISAPLGVSSLLTIINSRADILLLSQMRSDAEVALYSAAYRFLDLAATVAIVLMVPIVPVFSKMILSDRPRVLSVFKRMVEWLMILVLPVAIAAPYFSVSLLKWLYGNGFEASAAPFDVLAWAAVLVFLSLIGSSLCLAMRQTHLALWSTSAACIINVVLNLLFIPRFGYLAAAWATVASEIVLAGFCFAFITVKVGSVFDLRPWCVILMGNFLFYKSLQTGLFGSSGLRNVIVCFFFYALFIFVFHTALGRKIFISPALLFKVRGS